MRGESAKSIVIVLLIALRILFIYFNVSYHNIFQTSLREMPTTELFLIKLTQKVHLKMRNKPSWCNELSKFGSIVLSVFQSPTSKDS